MDQIEDRVEDDLGQEDALERNERKEKPQLPPAILPRKHFSEW